MRSSRRARAYATYASTADASDASASIALRMLIKVDAGPAMDAGIKLDAVGDGVGVGNAEVGLAVGASVAARVGVDGALVGVRVATPGALGIFRIIPVCKRVVVVMSFTLAINGYFAPLPYTFCAMIQRLSPGCTVYVCSLGGGSVATGALGVAVGVTRVGGGLGVSFGKVGTKIGVGKTYGRLVGSSVGDCAKVVGACSANRAMPIRTKQVVTKKTREFIYTQPKRFARW